MEQGTDSTRPIDGGDRHARGWVVRRTALAATVAVASIGLTIAIGTAAPTTGGAAAPVCGTGTDNWVGPATTGSVTNWNASTTDWSQGSFPTSSTTVCVDEPGSYTVVLTSGSSVGQLVVGGSSSGSQTVEVQNTALGLDGASYVESGGTLTLESYDNTNLNGSGSLTVASGGALTTTGQAATNDDPDFIQVPVTNQVGGTVTLGAIPGGYPTDINNNTLFTNDGTVNVSSGGSVSLTSGSSFTQSPGATLTNSGTFTESGGNFTDAGGSETGNPVVLAAGTLADSAGTGSFQVTGATGLTGTIPSGQTVTDFNTALSLSGTVTDDGTLTLESYDNTNLNGSGSLTVASGGALTTTGQAATNDDPDYIQVPVTNQVGGTVTLGAISGGYATILDNNTLFTNDGTVNVSSGGSVSLTSGSSFTQSPGATLTNSGTFTESGGTFTDAGGSETGNPVVLDAGTLADSAGTGSFQVTGNTALNGTIPSGQTVTVVNTALSLSGTVTDDGTLTLESYENTNLNGSGSLTVASGGALTTTGESGSTDNSDYIQVPVTNLVGGTVTIGAIPGGAATQQNNNTAFTNDGSLDVVPGGEFALSAGSTLTNTATGTIGVAVDGPAGGISGPGVTLQRGSTLAVSTVGSPAVGSSFTPIGGPVTGTFSLIDWPG